MPLVWPGTSIRDPVQTATSVVSNAEGRLGPFASRTHVLVAGR
jgi:hypothetical protein